MTIAQLTELLGWASVINLGYLFLAAFILIFMKGTISSIHEKLFGIDKKEIIDKYFNFLSYYKIVTLVFVVAPYLALKIMGQ